MEPSVTIGVKTGIRTATLRHPGRLERFSRLKDCDIERVRGLVADNPTRSCDFTLGGIFLWIDYFHYRYAIVDDTLFIRGVTEDNVTIPAFSVPVGHLPIARGIAMIRDYCRRNGMDARFSAVPECYLPIFKAIPGARISELTDFADYVYEASALATLTGKKLAKKRNHVNRFMADNPGYSFEPITAANIDDVRAFYDSLGPKTTSTVAAYESMMTRQLLDRLDSFPFETGVLSTPDKGVVAFTIAEVIGDTLHVHIEKMDHAVDGAGETINKLFAAEMTRRFPQIRYINRQDDSGDEGLRRAKLSYHPAMMVRKYNVTLP